MFNSLQIGMRCEVEVERGGEGEKTGRKEGENKERGSRNERRKVRKGRKTLFKAQAQFDKDTCLKKCFNKRMKSRQSAGK